jgi:hypothetical protein
MKHFLNTWGPEQMNKLPIIKSQFRALIIKCKKINSTTKNPSDGHYPFQVPSSNLLLSLSLSLSLSLCVCVSLSLSLSLSVSVCLYPHASTPTAAPTIFFVCGHHPPRIREPPITKNTRTTTHEYENHPPRIREPPTRTNGDLSGFSLLPICYY